VDHWPNEVSSTASHQHRKPTDMTLPFIYAQVALHEFNAVRSTVSTTQQFTCVVMLMHVECSVEQHAMDTICNLPQMSIITNVALTSFGKVSLS
jgi:hypothetical protein